MLNCVYDATYECTPNECESLCMSGGLLTPLYLSTVNATEYVNLADMNQMIVDSVPNFLLNSVTSCPGYASCADFCSIGSSGSSQLAAIIGGIVGGIVGLALLSLILFKTHKTFRQPTPPNAHIPYAIPVQLAVVAIEKSEYDAGNVGY